MFFVTQFSKYSVYLEFCFWYQMGPVHFNYCHDIPHENETVINEYHKNEFSETQNNVCQ